MGIVWQGVSQLAGDGLVSDRQRASVAPVYLDRMLLADLDEVAGVEREAYSLPWPSSAYRHELRVNKTAHYLVVRRGEPPAPLPEHTVGPGGGLARRPFPFSLLPPPHIERPPARPRDPVIGHGGLWKMPDEAHITTIAVRNAYRGQGIGELLMVGLIDLGYVVNTERLTLEVRVSNIVAQNLYRKYGFKQTGTRIKYYSDNNEDAYIMTTDPIDLPSYRALLAFRKRELAQRFHLAALPDWQAWSHPGRR
jgi:[ribosomal protein S18]-alanine N-acetyltransferase